MEKPEIIGSWVSTLKTVRHKKGREVQLSVEGEGAPKRDGTHYRQLHLGWNCMLIIYFSSKRRN